MVKKAVAIIWDKEALSYLKLAIKYIRKDSPQNARHVKARIITCINELADNPMRHAADKYRDNNDGSYRAFEIYRFRIAYFISIDTIRIVRIRHTSQEPMNY
jgi:plasmid stabilization system protein ParE